MSTGNDDYRWTVARALPVLRPEGQVIRWAGTWTDVDDRKRLHAYLGGAHRGSGGVAGPVRRSAGDRPSGYAESHCVLDIDGLVIYLNPVASKILGRGELGRVRRHLAALSWLGRIREAIDEDRMVLYSQPIIPAAHGNASEELLLRMISRTGEIIAPSAFLPVAERYGLITEIDRWVAAQAIRLAATGRRVEANLSATSISLDILPLIENELRASGADPANVIFEITETALMVDIEKGEALANRLTDLGCGLALDDFGTGFGSFTLLKRLPIGYLKIDVEFVRDLLSSPANQHLVRAIVSLAKAFNLQTIAEGVEDQPTWDLLRQEGVDFGQGFHLGNPAPIH